MKRFYCAKCGELKNRFQIRRKNDTRVAFYECKYCHSQKIYFTEDIICILINKLNLREVESKHGIFI